MAKKKNVGAISETVLDTILSAWINRPSAERKLSLLEQIHLLVLEMNDADKFKRKIHYKYPQHEDDFIPRDSSPTMEMSRCEAVLFSIDEVVKIINKKLDPPPAKPSLAKRILSTFKRKEKFDYYD